ncbi:GerMN domain-containing protein [Candidatus Uhrbacteria bacterium]|nr:GerMN domain-containing protein [Candidatus Uhrbacteria bacterium]
MNKKRLILLILIILGVWYFWGRGQKADGPAQPGVEEAAVEEEIANNPPQPSLTLREGDNVVRVHYFTKEALASCAVETTSIEQAIDPKYGHFAAGALVTMTLPLSAEHAAQYASALPTGTRLLTMQIDKEGTARADYNSALDGQGAPCLKAERRAQIERTLKEFSEIKKVVITVEGEVW